MYDTEESRLAKRVLDALERGTTPVADAAVFANDIDPVLVHAIITYIREVYPVSDPAGPGVMRRLVELTRTNPRLQAKHDEGARDPIIEWFRSAHDWREFRGKGVELIDLLVDKLES